MIKEQKNKNKYPARGFSMFLAVIVMSALLLIAYSVINISVKETQFSTANRESQYAIFAADAGIECAIYWDAKQAVSAFATSTVGTIHCAGHNEPSGITTGTEVMPDPPTPVSANSRIGGGGDANATSTFYLLFNQIGSNPVPACVVVSVNKRYTGSILRTRIESKGYNQCSNTADPRRVERAIEVTY